MATFTLKEFENLNLYSNDSLQKIITSTVNSSSNAVLVSMYEDSVILLDHTDGRFFIADYEFDSKNLRIKLENFEEVELERDTSDFEGKVHEYFDEEDASVAELTESYKDDVLSQERYISELINEALSTKDFSEIIDYGKIKDAIDPEIVEELRKEKFFKAYEERLKTHPLTEIKMFNWEDEVNVSLVETEPKSLVNKTAVEKANDLWKRDTFKESFEDAAVTLIEDVEEGAEKFKNLMEDFPQVFYLDSADRKTLFGKTILATGDLKDDMSILIKGLDLLFEKFDLAEMREEYLAEADDEEEDVDEKGDEKEKEDEAPEVEPMSYEKAISAIKSVAKNIEDETEKKKLDDAIKALEKGKEEGTRPEVVKEAVALLTL